MAVRPQHVHDGGIVERRLRPIYDWLDYGNNKKALQEAEKVLKKSPSLQAARALKALALLRLGKSVEAHTVLDALADEKPSDDTTLQAMSISYRESQQLHRVCVLYEAAVKEEPLSEELHSHLFMAYVRVGDYRAQQRAAMALYKFAPKNPYYFWAVMSIVLQAKESEDTTKKNILLSLAQRMVDNFITENKVEAEQEARLYIMILELQEKWEEIVKFIDSPLYNQLVPGSNAPARIPYLQKLGRWKELNLLCKELLFDNQDRWDYYLPYLDSIFELMKEPPSDDNSLDDTAEKCHEFICQLVESMTSGRTLRGPYLARLELWKRLSNDGDPTALMGSGVALCVQYLRVFAHKPCAVPDLRPYLSMIPQKEREEHCRDFLTCLGLNENSMPETTDDIQRHVSCLSSWLLTAAPVSGAEYLTLASSFRRQYERALRCGYVTATLTEFCAADGYAILAAHMYFFAAMSLGRSWPWLSAAALLETALQHSPANFHAKLLLLTLYHLLGNAHAADTVYVRLEAKHVQLVSLGWLHAARLPATAAPRALQLLADTRAFHHHHAKDSVDHLTYAYKYGTFEKLSALYSWRARLAMCAGGAMAARARALAALLAAPADRPPAPDPLPKEPTDNRDLNVIVNYEPPQFHNPKLKEQTFERDLAFLRLKDGLVSAIALCIELAENRPAEEKKPLCEQLKTCIEAFSMAMDKCKERYHEKERLSISTPFPSKIIAFVNSPVPYRELYDSILSVVLALATPPSGESAHARTKRAAASVSAAKALLPRREDGQDRGWTMRERMEDVSNYLEFIGVVTFLLGICKEIVTPTNNVKKSKKKANQSPEEVKTHELLNTLNDAVQESIEYLEEIFDNWPSYDFDTSLEDEFKEPEAREKHLAAVVQKLKTGQQDMVNDVKNMLRNKLKYLKSLK